VNADSGARSRFATTQWSLILAAAGSRSTDAEEALSRLCSLYWYPVFAFVRRQGHSADEAQDLTQGFFTRLLEKRELANADQERGRFRSFLLTACRHFIANEHDRMRTIKRGGGAAAIPIDVLEAEGRYERTLVNVETPERLYERQWALTLMAVVLDGLRNEYAAAGNESLFDRLSEFVTDPTGTYSDAARDLDMTVPAVKMAVHRLRRRYREALRERVADTVGSPEEVDDEIRHLMMMVANVTIGS
jgi:DNA-directed RNA polymerase specialized sigma24 family protein